jgi:triosephosphate isomerase
VLVGHSERRQLFGENLDIVAKKFNAALAAGLQPILCVGETVEQREQKLTDRVIKEQIESVIAAAGIAALERAIVAYEPIWAIGTGLTASPEQAQEVHAAIRAIVAKQDINVANSLRILYGGSVKQDNAAGLFAMPDIDGGLVGGAALDANGFLGICQAAVLTPAL